MSNRVFGGLKLREDALCHLELKVREHFSRERWLYVNIIRLSGNFCDLIGHFEQEVFSCVGFKYFPLNFSHFPPRKKKLSGIG